MLTRTAGYEKGAGNRYVLIHPLARIGEHLMGFYERNFPDSLFGGEIVGKKVELPRNSKKQAELNFFEGAVYMLEDLVCNAPIDITPIIDKVNECLGGGRDKPIVVELDRRPEGYVPKDPVLRLDEAFDEFVFGGNSCGKKVELPKKLKNYDKIKYTPFGKMLWFIEGVTHCSPFDLSFVFDPIFDRISVDYRTIMNAVEFVENALNRALDARERKINNLGH